MAKTKKVLTISNLSAIYYLVSKDSEITRNATAKQLGELCCLLPERISIEYEDDEGTETSAESTNEAFDKFDGGVFDDYYGNDLPEKTVIRINTLKTKAANYYKRNPLAGNNLHKFIVVDFKDKSSLDKERNGMPTVAGLNNYPKLRKALEESVGLQDLYSEIRHVNTDLPQNKNKMKSKSKEEGKINIYNIDEVEMLGNFSNTKANLLDIYTMNNNIRILMLSGRGTSYLGRLAMDNGLTDTMTADSFITTMLAYYGVINTEDTVEYSSFEKISPKEFAIIMGKTKDCTENSYDILKDTHWNNINRHKDTITRYEIISLAVNNMGAKVNDAYIETLEQCDMTNCTGSRYFKDIKKDSEHDTLEVGAFYTMGIIKPDDDGNARLDEEMSMSKAIRTLMFILESATAIDLESTAYIDVDEATI